MDHDHPQHAKPVSLTPADAEALDALLESGRLNAGPSTTGDERAKAVHELFNILDQHPVDDPSEDLVRQTLARVEQARQRRKLAEQAYAIGGAPIAFRWSELVAVAAVLMIALSLIWPALRTMRNDARRVACSTNLAQSGVAFNDYAADHDGALPRGKFLPGSFWLNTGEQGQPIPGQVNQSNSAHLYRLITFQYIHPEALACPENEDALRTFAAGRTDWKPEESSYSYQNQFGSKPLRIDSHPSLAVLADKNPMFAGPIYHRDLLPDSPSELHNRIGQNVLTADGTVRWTTEPLMGDDNIWFRDGLDPFELEGNETPARPGDAFLVP